jgi:ABC-type transport system substrate-binding protein
MAMPVAVAVAREVVEYYPTDIGSHPVGTGPFVLKDWRRSSRIVLEASPSYRVETFSGSPGQSAEDRAIYDALQGKRLPIVGRVEIDVIEEPQPRWLAFLNREHDYLEEVPNEFITMAAPNGKLAPGLVKRGVRVQFDPQIDLTFTYYNMRDPVIGGYTPEKIALRRALNLAYNSRAEQMIARKGQAIIAQGMVPPGAAGYDPNFRSIADEYDPAKAKALLDLFGYIDRDGDGMRELPDGKPLVLELSSPPQTDYRELEMVWQKSMDAIGIRIKFREKKWPELNKESMATQLQMSNFLAWYADYPDGDNFLQLLYGPNASPQSNFANFDLPEFNHLYERARRMPERTRLYEQMTELFFAYAPWRLGMHRVWTSVNHPWLKNYVKHPIVLEGWKYFDVDVPMQRKAMN